jgi:MFS family permease
MYSLVAVFLLASICGLVDILLFLRIREVLPPVREEDDHDRYPRPCRQGAAEEAVRRPAAEVSFKSVLVSPLKDETFRKLAFYASVMTFAQIVAAPFFIRHLIEAVGMGPVAVDFLFMALGPVVAMLAVRFLGRLVDRWGRRPVLVASQALTIFSVVPYFFVSARTPDPAWLVGLGNWLAGGLGGLFGADWSGAFDAAHLGATLIMSTSLILGSIGWSGVMLAQGTIVFGFADGKGRSRYVSAFAVFAAIGGVAGGLAGGVLASALGAFSWDRSPWILGPFIWNNWHAVFLLSFLARIASLFLAARLPDPGSGSVRAMVRHMGSSIHAGVSTWLNKPVRFWSSRARMRRRQAQIQARRRRDQRKRAA